MRARGRRPGRARAAASARNGDRGASGTREGSPRRLSQRPPRLRGPSGLPGPPPHVSAARCPSPSGTRKVGDGVAGLPPGRDWERRRELRWGVVGALSAGRGSEGAAARISPESLTVLAAFSARPRTIGLERGSGRPNCSRALFLGPFPSSALSDYWYLGYTLTNNAAVSFHAVLFRCLGVF